MCLYSPGKDPDIWKGVKSNVLSRFLSQELEANTEILNAEYSLGRFSFAGRERTSLKGRKSKMRLGRDARTMKTPLSSQHNAASSTPR